MKAGVSRSGGFWNAVLLLFTPETVTPERPGTPDRAQSIVRNYLLMRVVIGSLSVLLPVVLMGGEALILDSKLSARGSISSYYHSSMRDYFVGTMIVIGVFLVTYKFFELSLDNLLSIVGGIAAIVVAFFPTGIPESSTLLPTGIQERLGQHTTSIIHMTAAAVFILTNAAISFCFGLRAGRRPRHASARALRLPSLPPPAWRWVHWTCAGIIIAALLFVAITRLPNLQLDRSVLYGEVVALLAFGVSWFLKGAELDMLFPNWRR